MIQICSNNFQKKQNAPTGNDDAAEEEKKPQFNPLEWLSDHLRQYVTSENSGQYNALFEQQVKDKHRQAEILERLKSVRPESPPEDHWATIDTGKLMPTKRVEQLERSADQQLEQDKLFQILHDHPSLLFRSLDDDDLKVALSSAKIVRFNAGDKIAEQAVTKVEGVYVIQSGNVSSTTVPGLNEHLLGVECECDELLMTRSYGNGDHLLAAEVVLGMNSPFSNLTAVDDVTMFQFTPEVFMRYVSARSLHARNICMVKWCGTDVVRTQVWRYSRVLLALDCLSCEDILEGYPVLATDEWDKKFAFVAEGNVRLDNSNDQQRELACFGHLPILPFVQSDDPMSSISYLGGERVSFTADQKAQHAKEQAALQAAGYISYIVLTPCQQSFVLYFC